ncbi:MAG: AEC family transporter [Mogibacterium sp.]|nr:AEC family transporter [Mogibacterium sp.]
MGNVQICINTVLPMFIYILIGVVIKRTGMMTDAENKRFNKVLFTFFYPVLMFNNIFKADLAAAVDLRLIIFALAFITVTVAVTWAVVVRIESRNSARGAMIQAIYRSNFVLMGIMVVQSIFGDAGLPVVTMLITIVIPFFNIIAVIVLEYFRGGKPDMKNMLINTIRNPLIIGAIAGAICSVIHLSLPYPVETVLDGIAAAAPTVAMIMLGVSFDPSAITAKRRDIMICLIGRLAVIPMIGLPLAAVLGFRGPAFVSLLIIMASPTAVSTYPMAVSLDSDAEIAGSAIMLSTPVSCITLFVWLLIFKNLGIY